jgi:hypothetical protein
MHPVTLIARDATELAIIHARAAQSRAHRSHLRAIHTVGVLMRSPTARWSKIAHWVSLASHYQHSARVHQEAAAYFARQLNARGRQTAIQSATTHYNGE